MPIYGYDLTKAAKDGFPVDFPTVESELELLREDVKELENTL